MNKLKFNIIVGFVVFEKKLLIWRVDLDIN